MANVVAKRKSGGAAVRTNETLVTKEATRLVPPCQRRWLKWGRTATKPNSTRTRIGGRGDMQRALYALVRECVYSGAHATHARVELAYGGSHASGARDGVAFWLDHVICLFVLLVCPTLLKMN